MLSIFTTTFPNKSPTIGNMIRPAPQLPFLKQCLQPFIHSPCVSRAPGTALVKLPQCRHASADAVKTIRLEKPTNFVPPSHGRRLKKDLPRHYGPELTSTQKTTQATKKYPNMMPPPGTFMFWFLTNRRIHAFISLVCLRSPLQL